jgi:putative N6-adenine-specific DNA methylase
VCAKEASALDANPRVVSGGVELSADLACVHALIARANLQLRLPTRVLLRVGETEARDFARLRKGTAAMPWKQLLPTGAPISIRAAAARCRLYHTGAIAEQVALALADAVGARVVVDDEDAFSVLVRGSRDRFTLSLDTSGARLHQRGWRQDGGAAPIRETLASAVLALAAHAPDEPLLDPMCGSGTIVLEAALAAIGRAPGLDRHFSFERFIGHDAAAWEKLREDARAQERPRALPFVGSDADPAQIETALRNAERAGVHELVRFEVVTLASVKPRSPRGLLATNAPYGRRVAARGSAALAALYAELARLLRGPMSAWRAAILAEDRKLLAVVTGSSAIALENGGLRVWLGQRKALTG